MTKLPGLRPRVIVQRPRAAPTDLAMRADTLWIDTDRAICTLTFRGHVALESPRDPGRVLIAMEQGAQRLEIAEVEALAPPLEPPGSSAPPPLHDPGSTASRRLAASDPPDPRRSQGRGGGLQLVSRRARSPPRERPTRSTIP